MFVISLVASLRLFSSTRAGAGDSRLSIPSAHDNGRINTFDP